MGPKNDQQILLMQNAKKIASSADKNMSDPLLYRTLSLDIRSSGSLFVNVSGVLPRPQ